MADATRDFTVGVRLSPHERGVLDGLVAESGVGSPAALVRRILQAVDTTTAGREGVPALLAHLADAERETARRVALVSDPARWSGQVPPGELWADDPGVVVASTSVSTSLPNGEVHVVRVTPAARCKCGTRCMGTPWTGTAHPDDRGAGAPPSCGGAPVDAVRGHHRRSRHRVGRPESGRDGGSGGTTSTRRGIPGASGGRKSRLRS